MFPNRAFPTRYFPGTYFPKSSSGEMIATVLEDGEATDTALYSLVDALLPTVEEVAEVLERIEYDLTSSFVSDVAENAEALDRALYDLVAALTYTISESAAAADIAEGVSGSIYGPSMVIIAHIYEYFADGEDWAFSSLNYNTPSHDHAGRVITWGRASREIPVPPTGPPRLGQMEIEFDDLPDPVTGIQYFRSTFGRRTPKGKRVDIKIGPAGGSEALFQTPASGVIEHVTFPPGKMRLQINDVRYKWLQKRIPGLINRTNFPNLPPGVSEGFAPFIWGNVFSVGFGEQGAIKLTHVDTANHRYLVARHPIQDVTVYRKATGDTEFAEVSSGYSLTTETLTFNGVPYLCTFVQFDSDQDGAEIRADVEGSNIYGAWGLIPAHSGVSENAIDFAISLLFETEQIEQATTSYDYQSFATVRQQFEDKGYSAAYAITEPITPEVALTQIFSTFLIHWFPDRFDRLKVVMTTEDTPANAPVFGDFHKILRESEMPELSRDTRNRINYKFAKLYADGQWGNGDAYDNEGDQALIADSRGNPIIEAEDLELHACRDEDVALLLAVEWSLWRDQDAHRVRFQVDMPTNLTTVDIARDCLLTHYGGLNEDGWNRERFIPYKVTDMLDGLRFEIEAIRRVTIDLPQSQVQDRGQWRKNARIGLNYYPGTRTAYFVVADTASNFQKMAAFGTDTAGETEPLDDGTYPTVANEIDSFDAITRDNDGNLHVVTQERTTGRVAYSLFNQATKVWDILNETILASNSDGDCGCCIEVRSNGNPIVAFSGDREASSGCTISFGIYAGMEIASAGDFRRVYWSERVDGSWTTPVAVGAPSTLVSTAFPYAGIDYNGAVHVNIGRMIRGDDERVRFVYSVDEPADVASTPELYTQILNADDTLSAPYKFKYCASLDQTPECCVGDPDVFEYDGTTYHAVPVGLLFSPKLYIWEDSGSATAPAYTLPLTGAYVQPDTVGSVGTQRPPMTVRWFKDKLHVVIGTRLAGTGEWAALKTIEPPFSDVEPDSTSRDDQVGPTWPESTYARHDATFATIRGRDYLFKVTSGNLGIPGEPTLYSIFERYDINDADEVPTDNGYTLAEWVDDNS